MPRIEPVELAGIPACDADLSDASVLQLRGRGYLAYDARDPDRSRAVALVRLDGLRHLVSRGPNDEAFHRHRFFPTGLEHFAHQELRDSPWIPEIAALLHRNGDAGSLGGLRHFVFSLKETTVDAIARDVILVGMYPSHDAAMRNAMDDAIAETRRT